MAVLMGRTSETRWLDHSMAAMDSLCLADSFCRCRQGISGVREHFPRDLLRGGDRDSRENERAIEMDHPCMARGSVCLSVWSTEDASKKSEEKFRGLAVAGGGAWMSKAK